MSLPPWLQETLTLALSLSHWQQLGLAFLLGSFAVATWSDLKYLAAQREFLEVWLFFLVAVLIHDAVQVRLGRFETTTVLVKWGLIAALSVLSLQQVGALFRLAPGDVAALAAAASLLPPALVVALFAAAKGLSLLLAGVLSRGRPFYPFMPVVSLATLAVLVLGGLVEVGSKNGPDGGRERSPVPVGPGSLHGPFAHPALALGRNAQLGPVAGAALGLAAHDALLRRLGARTGFHGWGLLRVVQTSAAAIGGRGVHSHAPRIAIGRPTRQPSPPRGSAASYHDPASTPASRRAAEPTRCRPVAARRRMPATPAPSTVR